MTGILLPSYETAGATSLTLPALGCCVDQNDLSGGLGGSNAGAKRHLYFDNNLTCRGLRVGERFRYIVDRSRWHAKGKVSTEGDCNMQSLRRLPKPFKFSKPVIPGILR